MALILLNLAGGACVADLDELKVDEGSCRMLRQVEPFGLARRCGRDVVKVLRAPRAQGPAKFRRSIGGDLGKRAHLARPDAS
ncbi:hypothetical protein EDC27_1186 [Desulfosoma caldarium]|uniref:Uncharacterized protein n=1 Tax=Desulfosoma caldarium TaxID=610254 RepID=A0A3N1UZA4_9BACT|nr:hypothetical protein EDC27_1186 [Desulfosoma caldarium]